MTSAQLTQVKAEKHKGEQRADGRNRKQKGREKHKQLKGRDFQTGQRQ